MKIVSIVGRKNSGKTSLSEKVVRNLTNRGYHVGTIKHSHHKMEMDRENTDTWKHKLAGSEIICGIGATTFFNIREQIPLNRLLFLMKILGNPDFIVIEGFKTYPYPKIATSPEIKDEYTIEVVDSFKITDEEIDKLLDKVEKYSYDITDTLYIDDCGYSDGESIAREIIKGNIKLDELDKVDLTLSIDGNVVGVNEFVNDFMKETILGMIKTLNIEEYGVTDTKNIQIVIKNKTEPEKTKNEGNIVLFLNNKTIEINDFVQEFMIETLIGMINSLNTENYNLDSFGKIVILIDNIEKNNLKNASITLSINDTEIKINKFVCGIMKESIYGMVKTLDLEKYDINEINHIKINYQH